APARVEEGREEDAESSEREPDQLGVLGAAGASARALAPPDPGRRARLQGALLAAARHAEVLRRDRRLPFVPSSFVGRTRRAFRPRRDLSARWEHRTSGRLVSVS